MAVQFNGSSLLFQFVDLDLDTIYTSDPSFQEALNAPVFDPADALANLYVPRDWFSTMFWVKFPFEDLSDTNPMYYAVDPSGWRITEFSECIVTPETSVNPRVANQTISQDFVRSILKDITGSIGLNSLFSNKAQMISKVKEVDTVFNNSIIGLIENCGSLDNPKDNTTVINNPTRVLLNSIINKDSTNPTRRTQLLNQIRSQLENLIAGYQDLTYYVYGTTDSRGTGYYYPLYLSYRTNTKQIVFTDVYIDQVFYIPLDGHYAEPLIDDITGKVDYAMYDNNYITIPFEYGDTISVRLTYKPQQTNLYGRTLNNRSYIINLNLNRDSVMFLSPNGYDASMGNTHNGEIIVFEPGDYFYPTLGDTDLTFYSTGNVTLTVNDEIFNINTSQWEEYNLVLDLNTILNIDTSYGFVKTKGQKRLDLIKINGLISQLVLRFKDGHSVHMI
jgi:hypothetical protein